MSEYKNPITKEEQKILTKEINPDNIQIKPDGTLYMPHQDYRKRLIEAVGVGSFQPGENAEIYEANEIICYKAPLYVKGHLISIPVGGCENKFMDYDDRIETARGDWLKRGCKDLGIFLDIPARGKEKRDWLNKYAIQVKLYNQKKTKNNQPKGWEYLWRRSDDLRFDEKFWYYKDEGETIVTGKKPPKTTPQKPSQPARSTNGDSLSTNGDSLSTNARMEETLQGAEKDRNAPPKITSKQLKRLFAIASKEGVTNEHAKSIIQSYGFESSKDIFVDDYDKIIEEIKDGMPSLETLADQAQSKTVTQPD